MKSYFFLPKCNMGNIRAHIKKIQKKKREKSRERENKNALSHARRLVVRRRDLVGVVRHLVYFLRERTREVNSRAKSYRAIESIVHCTNRESQSETAGPVRDNVSLGPVRFRLHKIIWYMVPYSFTLEGRLILHNICGAVHFVHTHKY